MNWRIIIHDPQGWLKKEFDSKPDLFFEKNETFVFFDASASYGTILDEYVNKRDNYDRHIFVYDGNNWLAGPANDALCTIVFGSLYNGERFTADLIDHTLRLEYEEKNAAALLEEILKYVFYFTRNSKNNRELLDKLQKSEKESTRGEPRGEQ